MEIILLSCPKLRQRGQDIVSFFFFLINLLMFREQEREGEKEGQKHQCVVASWASPLGTWPTIQACVLTGN